MYNLEENKALKITAGNITLMRFEILLSPNPIHALGMG